MSNEPINFLFFFIPLLLIYTFYMVVVNVNSIKQPFGLKPAKEIDRNLFLMARKKYYKKVIIFSTPITVIVPIISMFIKYFYIGAPILAASILALAAVNFIFYFQGYKHLKNI